MKKCFKCKEIKELAEFYKHPKMPDGHVNKCKECNKTDVRDNREFRKDYYKAYDRVRSTTEHRKISKKICAAKPSRKEKRKIYLKSYAYNRKQKAATTIVSNAVRDGRLLKLPCWECGCLEVEGHHPDYDKPLDVVWLCSKHHAEIHRYYNHEDDKELLAVAEKGSRWVQKD